MSYVELHARSAFSFLRGAATPEDYVTLCSVLGYPAMALTDIDGVYGAPRFHLAAQKAGMQAHIGAEVSCVDGNRYALLCESRAGYRNLCRLLTRLHLGSGKAAFEDLAEFSNGLICLTANTDRASAQKILCAFGRENVYIELQRHLDFEEERRNQALVEISRSLRLPLVATNGVCYAGRTQREVFDVFTCLAHKTTLAQAGRLLSGNSERRLKSADEMRRLFSDAPEAIANTQVISSRLRFELSDLGYEFPVYPLPGNETIESFLAKRADEGARWRYQPYHDAARQQIEKELKLINKLRLGGYFLIVWDIVQFCRREGILCQGRGSAANSAVCYALGITAVDPVRMGLLFERFLSESRGEWPDIDIDLPSRDDREKVIQYVYRRYGERGAAMTANVITYRGRLAAREAGKVLGFEASTLARLSSLVPMWGWSDKSDTPEKQFSEAGLPLSDPRVRKFLEIVGSMRDLPRHLGQHSGGMVVCQGQLDSIVPLEPATMPGRVVVQWDKDDCASMGVVKIDLLGLGMMAVLRDCIGLIRDHWKEEIDLGRLPPDDPKVYETLRKADTIGMFQVESRAQQATLPRLKPTHFYDLVVEVALIRPGPIVGDMVHPYLARRSGREKPEPLHPSLEPVLARTLGVPLFQEQLLRMAMVAANFTGAEAEELRRAMGFKRSEQRMKEIEIKLRAGMSANDITGETQDRIVQSITSFALYGFPESHAASFALLAYASAYFKRHYLAAFLCAVLNNQPMGFYSPAVLVKDAQRHGLRVLPIDVNRSEWNCTVEEFEGARRLRMGLRYVRHLRAETGRAIAAVRPFHCIDDIPLRVPGVRKDEMEVLANAGALNSLKAEHRRDALWKAARAGRPVGPLLAEVPEDDAEGDSEAPLRKMTTMERLSADYAGTGLTIGRHPMYFRRKELTSHGVTSAAAVPLMRHGAAVRVAGNVIVRQRPGTAKGVVFVSLEDETGIINSVVMPDVFEANRLNLLTSPFLVISGRVQNVENVVHVLAQQIEPLGVEVQTIPSHDFK